ncbi:hypothetical protein PS838_02105 [Pseudomonas fluorescens]|jgi:hypothetical protein|nr:hypothetical protein PS838_02105 [Pseudomonas fluorescens]
MCRRYGLDSGFKKGPLYGIRFLDCRSGLRRDCNDSVTPFTNPNQNLLCLAWTVTERDATADISGSDNSLAMLTESLAAITFEKKFHGGLCGLLKPSM